MRSEGAETLIQWGGGALCSPLPCAPFSPFLSSEGHGTSVPSPPSLPMTCREGLGGWEVWLVLEQEAGTDTRAFSGPSELWLVSVDGPGLTLVSGEGRADMALGPAVGEGPVGKWRQLGSGLPPHGDTPGVSERLWWNARHICGQT